MGHCLFCEYWYNADDTRKKLEIGWEMYRYMYLALMCMKLFLTFSC